MNAAHRPTQPAPDRRWYAPDYRRRLRDAGAFRALSASAQVVLAALCDRANAAGVAWPSVETIARDYGLGESTVRRALAELIEASLVLVVRRAGKVSRYALILPTAAQRASESPVDPEHDPSQFETPPLSNRAPIMTMDHANDHQEQHDSAGPGAAVVVGEEPPTEELAAASPLATGHEEAVDAGAITLLAPEVVDRARELGLAPAKLNRYGTDRVRWVLDALDAARARQAIGNPAGWVMQALREHWALPGAVVQPALPFAQAAADAARPPEGTRWARARGAALALEVLDVNDSRAQLADGAVVPAHRWAEWEWFTECPDAPVNAGADREDEDLAPADIGISAEKRTALARLRLWTTLRSRTAAELEAKLEALALTADEWEAYQAAEVWLEANG